MTANRGLSSLNFTQSASKTRSKDSSRAIQLVLTDPMQSALRWSDLLASTNSIMRLFVDQLTNLDFSYLDADRGLVGETWLANIEMEGELDEQGMICDFGDVKKKLRAWLDSTIDHKLVIPGRSANLKLKQIKSYDHIEWQSKRGQISSTAPSEAHCFIDAESVTARSAAAWVEKQLQNLFPDSVKKITVSFSVETINGPYYHYSHGLKKHGGNCQRIAHGHRSKIEIWENESPSLTLAKDWAEQWRDIYIGSEEDCKQDPALPENYLFEYEAQQGKFTLSIPKTHCYVISTDTTVELLSKHISCSLKKANEIATYKVKAYEGMAKGAVTEQ